MLETLYFGRFEKHSRKILESHILCWAHTYWSADLKMHGVSLQLFVKIFLDSVDLLTWMKSFPKSYSRMDRIGSFRFDDLTYQ